MFLFTRVMYRDDKTHNVSIGSVVIHIDSRTDEKRIRGLQMHKTDNKQGTDTTCFRRCRPLRLIISPSKVFDILGGDMVHT